MSKNLDPHHGMNLRDARSLWRRLHGNVEDRRKTGEEVYRHPAMQKPICANKRRKDAPRELTAALRQLSRLRNGGQS